MRDISMTYKLICYLINSSVLYVVEVRNNLHLDSLLPRN